jgi:hypothetical protein
LYFVIFGAVASLPVLYYVTGGSTPWYDTQPSSLLVFELNGHLKQSQIALEKEKWEYLTYHLEATNESMHYVLSWMPEWGPPFMQQLTVGSFFAARGYVKQRQLESARDALIKHHEFMGTVIAQDRFRMAFRNAMHSLTANVRKDVSELGVLNKEERASIKEIEVLLKKFLSK